MGTYNIGADELEIALDKFLQGLEGEVYAETMAEAWNKLAEKHEWDDRLEAKGGQEEAPGEIIKA